MESIRFASKNISEKQFVRTLKKNVNDYFKTNNISPKANAEMVVKAIVMVLLYVGPFIVLLTVPLSAWIAFFCVILMGIGIAGVGMGVMHDATHGAISRK